MSNFLFAPINMLLVAGKAASNIKDLYDLGPQGIKQGIEEKLKENATPRNVALATLAATAVTAALLHPPTRMALCMALTFSYSLSMIAFNLIFLGLYLTINGTKGLASLAGLATSPLKEMMKDFKEGWNEEVTKSEPLSSVKVEEVLDAPQIQKELEQFWEETSSPSAPANTSNTIDNYLPNDVDFDEAWESIPPTNSAPATRVLTEIEEWNQLFDESGLLEEMVENGRSKSTQMVEEFTRTQKGMSLPLPPVEDMVGEFAEINKRHSMPLVETVSKQDIVNEFLKIRKLAPVDQWVNEFTVDQMADEFIKQQKGSNKLIQVAAVGLAAGALLFLGYKALQANKQQVMMKEGSEENSGVSFANISMDVMPQIMPQGDFDSVLNQNFLDFNRF